MLSGHCICSSALKLDLTDDQTTLRNHMRNFFQHESNAEVVRDAEPLGFDSTLWDKAVAVGLPGMALPDDVDGGGSDLLDTALVMEEMGRAAAPIPLVEHLVATRLLARAGATDANFFGPLCRGEQIATLALHPARDGVWRLAPAGAVASVIVGVDGDRLVASSGPPSMDGPRNHACSPIADRAVGSDVHPLEGDISVAIDEWKTLTAAALVGVAAMAQELGVKYAIARHQFDRPIGSFQAVQHGFADMVGPIHGARLLTGKAAWACDHEPGERARLASMAFLFATELAKTSTARSLHFHGGYGVMREYDIQLYYRRARGWPLAYQDTEHEYLTL